MGVTFAVGLIGMKLDPQKLYDRKIVKAYDHDYPRSMKFDPQTGNKLWKEEEYPIQGLNYYEKSDEYMLGKYNVFFTDDREECYVILAFVESDGRSKRIDLDPVDYDKKGLRETLEPLGLWDELQFGLWAVLNVNC